MKTILITGCSTGIGLHSAKALKERGYRVFATARKPEDVSVLKNLGLESYQLDVTDATSRSSALNDILSQTNGELFALFNNAGYMQAGAIEDISLETIRAQVETNFFGAVAMTQLVLPIMRKQGYGRIIQNSSILGIMTIPFYGAYNASKYALEGFTLTLRQELNHTDIKVSLINPGPIYSNLRENAYDIYQTTLKDQSKSAYQQVYKQLEASYFKNRGHSSLTATPEIVYKALVHALESKHPRAHYFVGKPAKTMAILKHLLPERTFEWVIEKIK